MTPERHPPWWFPPACTGARGPSPGSPHASIGAPTHPLQLVGSRLGVFTTEAVSAGYDLRGNGATSTHSSRNRTLRRGSTDGGKDLHPRRRPRPPEPARRTGQARSWDRTFSLVCRGLRHAYLSGWCDDPSDSLWGAAGAEVVGAETLRDGAPRTRLLRSPGSGCKAGWPQSH